MTSKRSLASILVAVMIAAAAAWLNLDPTGAPAPEIGEPQSTGKVLRPDSGDRRAKSDVNFDHYILALSWSPSWCAENDPSARTAQCDRDNDHGFIVHGLWPQATGIELAYCPTREPERVPDSLVRSYLDIIPSAGLAGHEWRKHGSCSGLDQKSYFAMLRAAYEATTIPESMKMVRNRMTLSAAEIETRMLAANPGLAADGVIVTCAGGQLSEIRICLDKQLGFGSCPDMERQACRARNVAIPPIP